MCKCEGNINSLSYLLFLRCAMSWKVFPSECASLTQWHSDLREMKKCKQTTYL